MPIGKILMVQAELKGHSSSINYIVRRLEQRQAAEGGAGTGVDSFPRRLSAGIWKLIAN
jgi:hypothetical protein